MIDKFFAIILILLFLPIFIFVSMLIFFNDGFPIFFIQKRIGINNTYFNIYKFRTMKKDTPNLATHLLLNPNLYLLEIGKFLRRTSLDELPNLFNIVKGDMVFVGPRPALFNQDDLIKLRLEMGVSKLKPGITGWAQINGRDNISLFEKVMLDQEYLFKKSFFFNIKILLITFSTVLFNKNISH
jgi:O-antigen biosynthesis protein WbqP